MKLLIVTFVLRSCVLEVACNMNYMEKMDKMSAGVPGLSGVENDYQDGPSAGTKGLSAVEKAYQDGPSHVD